MDNNDSVLVVASKVRAYLKSKYVKVSGDLVDALNKKVMHLLNDAADRTKANKRSTVKPQDI
jgi:histone H3/H4